MCTINIGTITTLDELEEHIEDIIVTLNHAYKRKTPQGRYDLAKLAVQPIVKSYVGHVILAESILPQLLGKVEEVRFEYQGATYTARTHEDTERIKRGVQKTVPV